MVAYGDTSEVIDLIVGFSIVVCGLHIMCFSAITHDIKNTNAELFSILVFIFSIAMLIFARLVFTFPWGLSIIAAVTFALVLIMATFGILWAIALLFLPSIIALWFMLEFFVGEHLFVTAIFVVSIHIIATIIAIVFAKRSLIAVYEKTRLEEVEKRIKLEEIERSEKLRSALALLQKILHRRETIEGTENQNELHNLIYDNIEQLIFDLKDDTIQSLLTVDKLEDAMLTINAGYTYSGSAQVVGDYLWRRTQRCKWAGQICNHAELMKMNENLKSAQSDKEYRYQKLYDMYQKFYTNDFAAEINSLSEFSDTIILIDNKKVFEHHVEYYLDFMTQSIPDNLLQHYSSSEIALYLNNAQIREKSKNAVYAGSINLSLYIALAKYLSKNYDTQQMLNLIIDATDTVKNIDALQREYEMEQERQRLLSGDLTYEKNLQLLQLSMSKIKTGAEFEEYLQMVFSKLGYEATMTKGSGDKGADLILKRNNITYIVQAKFYSQPVGNKAIQEAHTAKDIYKANKAAVITNHTFTKQAIEDAASVNVVFVDGDKLKILTDALARGEFLNVFG